MPAVNAPRGLVPVRNMHNDSSVQGAETFFVPSSDATALFIGDPVVLAGSADAAGVATVTKAGVNGPFTGVVVGFVPDGTTNMAGYRAASTAAYVLVHTDKDTLYEVQADTAIAAADIGLNAALVFSAGNTFNKTSGTKLDASTKAVTATLAVKIMGLSQKPGNDFGAYNKVLVKLNQLADAPASLGL